jgi:hypothetical protein
LKIDFFSDTLLSRPPPDLSRVDPEARVRLNDFLDQQRNSMPCLGISAPSPCGILCEKQQATCICTSSFYQHEICTILFSLTGFDAHGVAKPCSDRIGERGVIAFDPLPLVRSFCTTCCSLVRPDTKQQRPCKMPTWFAIV